MLRGHVERPAGRLPRGAVRVRRVGAGEGTTGASREHRVVILPDFQGASRRPRDFVDSSLDPSIARRRRRRGVVSMPDRGEGARLADVEVVAARHAEMGRRFMSITMHHTFGGGRDRFRRGGGPSRRTTPRTSTRGLTRLKPPGSTGRRHVGADAARPPATQLPPRVRGGGRRARGGLRATVDRTSPSTSVKERGCSHCYSNHDMVCRRIKCLDSKKKKLPRKDLEGTLWGTPPARPLGVAPPPTVGVSKAPRAAGADEAARAGRGPGRARAQAPGGRAQGVHEGQEGRGEGAGARHRRPRLDLRPTEESLGRVRGGRG